VYGVLSGCLGLWVELVMYMRGVREEEERVRQEEDRMLALADRAQLRRLCNGLSSVIEQKRMSGVRLGDYSPGM
jgi:hypothetical protein